VLIARARAGLVLLLVIAAGTLAGCGGGPAASRQQAWTTFADARHGIAGRLPPGWQRATVDLTPNLADPREILSVATFPLAYRPTLCAHVAGSALESLGPRGAFVTVQERGLDPGSTWPGFPARPARFGPALGGRSEAAECVPAARFTDHWFAFTSDGRHFHVLVAFGLRTPPEVQRQAWEILDRLRIDPAVRPDWRSSG
jgi:hypothetical protein